MGGFVLLHTSPGEDRSADERAATGVFADRGFAAPHVIRDSNYVLAVFPKLQASQVAIEQFADGDFVAVCGTFFYGGAVGKAAGIAFYRDYRGSYALRERAMGHYALILRKAGRTQIILDGFGGYHVFYDAGCRITSSSFLAVAATLDRPTLSAQAAYEYVFNGVVSGNGSLFDEVLLAPINAAIAVGSRDLEIRSHPVRVPAAFSAEPREAAVAGSMALLDKQFSALAAGFGNRVSCALSGGYDSRLILGLLRRHGVNPRVFVYGPAGDPDVTVARTIAAGEGIAIEAIDKDLQYRVAPDEFAEIAHANYLASDGYIWSGIFDNGAELTERARRAQGGAIVLNGGGGEIWRNFFYLLDRAYRPRELLWSFYSGFDPRTCTDAFDGDAYFAALEAKLAGLVGDGRPSLPRPTVEWLYHNFRCRTWDGRVNTINSTHGEVWLPFLERPLTEHASVIPIGWKNHGAFEAELIRRADHRLAQYPSLYGHNFSGPPPLGRRFADYGTYLRPPWLRRFTHRVKNRARQGAQWTGYLGEAYRNAVLPGGVEAMNALFRFDRITDPAQMGRILSLEYLVRQFGRNLHLGLPRPSARHEKCAA